MSVMISIRPKWCELIARRKKTIEVRKTRPKTETPFKCYIYCTKGQLAMLRDSKDTEDPYKYDKWEHAGFHESCGKTILGGKIIGEFVCDKVDVLFNDSGNPENYIRDILPEILKNTAMSYNEFGAYVGSRGKNIYGWHISDLVIYDKPKELSEFGLSRPPQSWCYCEEAAA